MKGMMYLFDGVKIVFKKVFCKVDIIKNEYGCSY